MRVVWEGALRGFPIPIQRFIAGIAGARDEVRTRTAEKSRGSGRNHAAVCFTDYKSFSAPYPAVNCWATIIRPLCGHDKPTFYAKPSHA